MNQNDKSIRWFIETMQFETMREAHEWAYSGAFNEIGNLYEGYITTDEKIAYALVFELTRINTIRGFRCNIHCDCDFNVKPIVYKVWVSK
ncbi:hypothetical protein MKZ24_00920 [Paenibacillus sp. FSL R7-0297]|uniref:hypothetical protein n=1 Tax=Paenibacillus sp. FSL R7-0297 TaxID=2921680 RepID=UPI0030F5A00A